MPQPMFRFVCAPQALDGAPAGWAAEMLRDGEIALLADGGGLDAVSAVAHALCQATVPVIRGEESPERLADTIMTYAASLPLVWVGDTFSEAVRNWARDRGPMTLLIDLDGPLPQDARRRIDRFVATLGRQSE